ncbi:hypothetical protein [Arthrobacter sp. NPDC090010]|uniref:hypothetical protein n=1 Tax=Arthrobacter sp. NPDC090010 TaxID=3363942 RepID=UPI00381F5B97
MPWWSWILLWVAVLALSALMFVMLGIKLFRQFTAMMRELGAATDMLSRLTPELEDPQTAERQIPVLGIYSEPEQMRADYEAGKNERRESRRQRRVARRAAAHRPQRLRDLGL